jgi:HAD superfamily hydrolase (TIGR01509 family)
MTQDHNSWKISQDRETLIIFDCDGVLVDSEVLAIAVDELVLADLGWSMGRDEIIARFVGRSEEHFVTVVEDHLGRSLPSDWADSYQHLYRESFTQNLRPVAGIVAALDSITFPICVASNGSHEKMEFTLGLTGLMPRFEGRIFSASDVARGKPAPDLFLHAASVLGYAPSDCVVVEDSLAGVQAALASNMRVIAYAGGFFPRGLLNENGISIIHNMLELPRTLETLIN